MNKQKLCVLVPNDHRKGGVANYFKVIKKYLPKPVKYIRRGESKSNESIFIVPFRLIFDYLNFCFNYWFQGAKLIVNTSLGPGNFLRDGIYLLLSSSKNYRIVFFHGWSHNYANRIDKNTILKFCFDKTFLKADHIIVLSSEFKKKLRALGYDKKVSVETTIVEEELVKNISWRELTDRRDITSPHLLYLSGMIKMKGIWELIKAIEILRNRGLNAIEVTMAGEGVEREALQQYAQEKKLDIFFPGYLQGDLKKQCFEQGSIFLFASYTEGMPTAVLEAMAFGLPVITTSVGGIPDFFEEGKMGLILEDRDPDYIADKIKYLLERPELIYKMSKYNYEYAQNNFYAGEVANRMKHIIDNEANR